MRARPARIPFAAALLAAGLGLPAGAVVTTVTDVGLTYALSVRVGAVSGVDTVAFSVAGDNVGLAPAPVAGSPAIEVWVTPFRPALSSPAARPVTLRVDSTPGLACQSGGCGATLIPFSQIGWTASNNGGADTGDIQSSRFDGSAHQLIASFNANATFCAVPSPLLCLGYAYRSNAISATRMQFSYDNDVVYPAGNYRGTVRFTASME